MSSDPDELRTRIAEEREALGETAAALAARADVVGQAKSKATHAAATARRQGADTLQAASAWGTDVVERVRTGRDRTPLFLGAAAIGALLTVIAVRASGKGRR